MYDADAGPSQTALVALVAVCAQFAADALISIAREYLAVGIDPRLLIKPLASAFFIDACLAPVGLAAGLAGTLSGRPPTYSRVRSADNSTLRQGAG